METSFVIRDPEEISRIYQSARKKDGPWSAVGINLKRRWPYHLEGQDGRKYLDFHSQILCDSLGGRNVQKEVLRAVQRVGMATFGPDFTHPILDQLQNRLAGELQKAGWGEYAVMFFGTGTSANERALRIGRAVLGARMFLMVLREGYSGAGLMNALCGHASWKGSSTIPLGMPTAFLDFRRQDSADPESPKNFEGDFHRALQTDAGNDALPYLLAEGGVQGVAGFERVDLPSLQRMAVAIHEKEGAVHYDFVQTMPWRTGAGLFCPDGLIDPTQEKTIPDLVTSAKGMGGGQQFAFLAVRKAFLARATNPALAKDYDTFARNLGSAVAALIVLDEVGKPEFQVNLQARSAQLRSGLETIMRAQSEKVKGLTGMGMMQGVRLASAAQLAAFKKVGIEQTGLVVGAGGIKGDVLRLGGRLDPTDAIINEFLQRFEDTLRRI